MSSAAQKKAVKEFKNVTSCNDKTATEILSSHGYNLERSLDHFFSNRHLFPSTSSSTPKADPVKLNRLFDQYADTDEKDTISDQNLAKFFTDLSIDPSSLLTLVYAHQLHCTTFGEIRRNEFITHYTTLGLDSLPAIRGQCASLSSVVKDPNQFKLFYRWLFEFVKEEGERKTIDVDAAIEMWTLVLGEWPLIKEWTAFVTEQKLKVVSHDLWMQLLEFKRDVGVDMKGYDADGAWPVIVDDFVEHMKKIIAKK